MRTADGGGQGSSESTVCHNQLNETGIQQRVALAVADYSISERRRRLQCVVSRTATVGTMKSAFADLDLSVLL